MELDSKWTKDYYEDDHLYNKYYKKPVNRLKIFDLYINSQHELFHIEKQSIDIKDGILDKTKLIYHLITNRKFNKKTYKPVSILKYNFTIDIDNIGPFLDGKISNHDFTLEKSIKDIKWENTIEIFFPLNSLYVLFYEKTKPNNITKRIYISNKKTRKKY